MDEIIKIWNTPIGALIEVSDFAALVLAFFLALSLGVCVSGLGLAAWGLIRAIMELEDQDS